MAVSAPGIVWLVITIAVIEVVVVLMEISLCQNGWA
jgi:hypothetical protein